MKFTEGYWLRSERANELYACCAYEITEIPGGLRVLAPGRPFVGRGDCLNIGTITTDFTASGDGVIKVVSRHYEAFEENEARFELEEAAFAPVIEQTGEYARLTSGSVSVKIDKTKWSYRFETADGALLTECGFRNLGYMRWDKQVSSMLPQNNYLTEQCQPRMVTELSLAPGEYVYGFGERFTAFTKNGQVVESWNEDGGTSSQIAYKCVPFYMTNRGYGVFVDSAKHVSFETASEKVECVGFSVPSEELRYYLMQGQPAQILDSYTRLTGRAALPPAWSFGLWLSTSFTTSYDRETTDSFVNGMKQRNIPLSVFHFDCFWMKEFRLCDFEWDKKYFPDFADTIKHYKDMGLRVSLWTNPYVAQGTEMFREGAQNKYFLQRKDGHGTKQIDWWQPGTALVDFTNPKAREWFQGRMKRVLDLGVDCIKADFGERIPLDVEYFDGSDAASMHNFYSYLYNKTVFELLEREKGKGNAVLFSRSGTAGSQKFPVHWGGDCSASYASMAETLRGGLSLAMSGFAFWSHDISGFEQTAPPDLYKRWAAFGLLSTHSRLHGSESYRVPWLFDEQSNDVVRHFTNLKCRLMPYIYSMAVKATQTGSPVMRPMVFEFPDDPAAATLDMQYMLGDSLLVAPVFNAEGIVDFYLPEGTWTHLLSGETLEGGRWFRRAYDYFSLGLFARGNSVIAFGSVNDRPDYDYAANAELHVYSLESGKSAQAVIPDISGNTALTAKLSRAGDTLKVELSGQSGSVSVVTHGMEGVAVEISR